MCVWSHIALAVVLGEGWTALAVVRYRGWVFVCVNTHSVSCGFRVGVVCGQL